MSTSSNNYSLHRYRIAYHSLNNPTNYSNNYFAGIYLHFHFLERKWRSLLLVSILSILFIFFYLTFSSFNNTEFVSSNLTFIGWLFTYFFLLGIWRGFGFRLGPGIFQDFFLLKTMKQDNYFLLYWVKKLALFL